MNKVEKIKSIKHISLVIDDLILNILKCDSPEGVPSMSVTGFEDGDKYSDVNSSS